jgi:3-hydroxyisobutyrate dehydrogenase
LYDKALCEPFLKFLIETSMSSNDLAGASVGFIGVGNMGWPMAACIAAAGNQLAVFDIDAQRVSAFAQETGAKAAADPKALAGASKVIITMLPTSDSVEQALNGPQGVLEGLSSDSVLLEMSSGVPTQTRKFAELVAKRGATLIDAPVSGGVARAKTGELAIMVGGEKGVVDRIEPLLLKMGSSILRTGGVGSAHAMKALNNLVSAGGFLIGIEALLIGKRFGLDPDLMIDVLNASTGMNNSTQRKFKQFVLSRKFNSGFGLDLMVKDLSIALEVGKQTSASTPFAALCRELCASAAALLGPGQDHTALAKMCERLAGTELS